MLDNTATARIKKRLFSRLKKGSDSKNSLYSPAPDTSRKLVQTLLEINLHNFVRCYEHGEYHLLALEGKFTDLELLSAWENIQLQWFDTAGGLRFKASMNSFKELILLRADRDSIILLRDMLLIFYYKPFATELNELCETKYEFNMDDKESYEEEINECADQHLRYLNIEIKLKELELEHAKNEKGNEVQNNESEFYILLIELSDHAKIHLTDQISMFEFAQRVNRLQEYINKSKPSNNGSKPE